MLQCVLVLVSTLDTAVGFGVVKMVEFKRR
jgi:hypothetical protein